MKTFLFVDEQSNDYCPTHDFKKVKFVSKLDGTTIGKGYVCITCEQRLEEYKEIVVRTNDKWLTLQKYKEMLLK